MVNVSTRLWIVSSVILLVITLIGGFIIWLEYEPGIPVEITQAPGRSLNGTVFLGGAVNNPGLYSFSPGDTIDALILAAGGLKNNANMSSLKLYIAPGGNSNSQKIDINRGDAWLLEALPGIGETLAQRIVNYRTEHGPFRTTNELLKVPGLGETTFERVKNLITVTD